MMFVSQIQGSLYLSNSHSGFLHFRGWLREITSSLDLICENVLGQGKSSCDASLTINNYNINLLTI